MIFFQVKSILVICTKKISWSEAMTYVVKHMKINKNRNVISQRNRTHRGHPELKSNLTLQSATSSTAAPSINT